MSATYADWKPEENRFEFTLFSDEQWKVVKKLLKEAEEERDQARRWAAAWKRAAKFERAEAAQVEKLLNTNEELLNIDFDLIVKQTKRTAKRRKRAKAAGWKRGAKATMTTNTTGGWRMSSLYNGLPHTFFLSDEEFITDGYGLYAYAVCGKCGAKMRVIRPGDIRCMECD